MRRFIFVTVALLLGFSAGCAELKTFGRTLFDTAPDAIGDVLNNPTPGGAASALLKWLIGAAAVAGTGVAGISTTKVVRRRRARARVLASIGASKPVTDLDITPLPADPNADRPNA